MKAKIWIPTSALALFATLFVGLTPLAWADDHDDEDDDEEHEAFENPLDLSEQDVIDFLEANFQEGLDDLDSVEEEDGEDAYRTALGFVMQLITDYKMMQREDPARAEKFLNAERLEYQAYEIADEVMDGDDEERTDALKRLREKVGQLVDTQTELQKAELAELEAEIEELRQMVREREQNRDQVVEDTVQEMTEDDEEED